MPAICTFRIQTVSYTHLSLPANLHEAVAAMQEDKLGGDTLGDHIVSQYRAGKEKEWDEYRTHVSSWELEKYLITY